MVYRLGTFPPEEQLAFLDQVAAVGFRVMYDVGQQQDDCGDPHKNGPRCNPHTVTPLCPFLVCLQLTRRGCGGRGNATCFDDPNSPALLQLKASIDLVKGHPVSTGTGTGTACC